MEKDKKPSVRRFYWASAGDFPVDSWNAREIAYCQDLETEGFSLREGFSNRADPSLAVILPDGNVLEYSLLVAELEKKDIPEEISKAIHYVKDYRRLCPYAPGMVPLFFGHLPI